MIGLASGSRMSLAPTQAFCRSFQVLHGRPRARVRGEAIGKGGHWSAWEGCGDADRSWPVPRKLVLISVHAVHAWAKQYPCL